MCYAKGYGVNKDIAEATKWYRQAAQKGNEKAKLAIKQLE
jgi:TPR repeat protein